ncbi:hypothetical protein Asppvi_008459 [Aspergillus pseudoviridinutans]|uniref:Uncharacterized protein n=1 Tax=Aspergillus pseudoviridinutans TaxID=1517512 RepID=A0A9P3BE22_9EURO|nr:uncharacterized protein Asppvi_008459 [Aspergillus pseudoviridinutans]GIJ89517.1 hypothetical protein Asppvi_008459 [Aspergillus pseudoviridinutans]
MNPHPPSQTALAASSVPGTETTTGHSRYIQMLLQVQDMPWVYNVIASVAHWVLLAGYLVVPGTFTSLQRSDKIEQALADNGAGKAILGTIQNPPLLVIACVLSAMGAALLAWLSWEWRENYIWLVSRIFTPVAMNAAAGLATTLINIYTARSGDWSVMAIVTTVMTGSTLLVSSLLAVVFKFFMLKKIEEEHELEEEHERTRALTSTSDHP